MNLSYYDIQENIMKDENNDRKRDMKEIEKIHQEKSVYNI